MGYMKHYELYIQGFSLYLNEMDKTKLFYDKK